MAGLTILKKETCLGCWSTCGGDTAVALHLRNTAGHSTSGILLPTAYPLLDHMAPHLGILDCSEK